tara:strand:+ start:459 stop:1559 length:1101 start_codon:yes stop_codon:yes gene_type:complete
MKLVNKLPEKSLKNAKIALKSEFISGNGKFVDELSENYSLISGHKYNIPLANGSVALIAALKALNLKSSDEVLIGDNSGVYSISATSHLNLKTVVCPLEKKSWSIDINSIIDCCNKRNIKAIILTHLYGVPQIEYNKLINFLKSKEIYIIEDLSEAHGCKIEDKLVGSESDICIYSFYANKIISSGEGGIICTSSSKISSKILDIINLYFHSMKDRNYIHNGLGYNFRMSNVLCAIALGFIENFNTNLSLRDKNVKSFREVLDDKLIFQDTFNYKCSFWVNAFGFHSLDDSNKVRKLLKKNKIEFRNIFPKLTYSKIDFSDTIFYKEKYNYSSWDIDEINGIYIPCHPGINNKNYVDLAKKIKCIL